MGKNDIWFILGGLVLVGGAAYIYYRYTQFKAGKIPMPAQYNKPGFEKEKLLYQKGPQIIQEIKSGKYGTDWWTRLL